MRPGVFMLAIVVALGASPGVGAQRAEGTPPAPAAHQSPPSPFASWRPPLGIPEPPFGIHETAAEPPSVWTSTVPGFYYVDEGRRGATDANNPNGTPGRPRQSIPTELPAGSVVELHGTYDRSHTSPATIVAAGTSAKPVFIRGASPSSRPVIRNGWMVRGTYLILENLEFGPADAARTGSFVIMAPASHVALRGSEVHGNLGGGGIGVQSWTNGAANTEYVVLLKNSVHDNGDVHAKFDQDVHCIGVGDHVHHVWVVDNEMARCSGDGIQINATANLELTTHHIYVGRNATHHNRQTGVWVKYATDVIVSQNESYGHRPSEWSMGQCMGGQYGPDRLWFIFNHLHDCDYGIGLMSDSDDGLKPTQVFFIGNLIHNIHGTTLPHNPGDAWGNSAILMTGGNLRYVVNNTIVAVDSGVNAASPVGSLEIVNNIIANVTEPRAGHMVIEHHRLADRTAVHDNLLADDPRAIWGGEALARISAPVLAKARLLAADPQFVNAAAGDFRPQIGSPADGRGVVHPAYALFQKLYGLDIFRDAAGNPRPRLSLGAFEPVEKAAPAAR